MIISEPGTRRVQTDSDMRVALTAGLIALAAGFAMAVVHHRAGLTLSHYDARAHLVVARRIIDSITPGWQQIGAVWLPLPHLLNAVPVQIDSFYRSGMSAVAISVFSFSVAVGSATWLVQRATGSALAAVAGASVLILDPNLLYLQATPMTEPLLIALMMLAIAQLYGWMERGGDRPPRMLGWTLSSACLTRYEAWPAAAAAVALTWVILWRRGDSPRASTTAAARLAIYPIATALAFMLLSRVTVGEWFVTGGFFVPDNPAQGSIAGATLQVWGGLEQLDGKWSVRLAGIAAIIVLTLGLVSRRHASLLATLALAAMAALPCYAFFSGHPFRIRYMVPLVCAVAVSSGLGVGLLARRGRPAAATIVMLLAATEAQPFDPAAPMISEAQWDVPNSVARRPVTACLARHYHGEKILASMASLAHYMQETSHAGFTIADFVHEGNGDLWRAAMLAPQHYVEWILIEEVAEGGDVLAGRARRDSSFLLGFTRVCEGGGVALYRRL